MLNLSQGKPGWFLPVSVNHAVRDWIGAKACTGLGSIANHVDLDMLTLHNQPERLTATAGAGIYATVARRYRLAVFGVWERYGNRTSRAFASLTLSVKL